MLTDSNVDNKRDNSMDKYLGKTLDDRYEIFDIVGSGGMAVVYKAMCHRLNRYVAIKIMRDEFASNEHFRQRFQAESKAYAMLSHPNIVAVYDVSNSPGIEYIVMELLEGVTLKRYLQKKGKLGWKETLYLSTQICKALSHAHAKGLVHRDIKPQNIMVSDDGTAKVTDFGIANLQTEFPDAEGVAIGSVHYISPEQALGLPVDARSDIYSLGIVMYEMLSGRLPFDGDDDRDIAMQHLASVAKPISELNPDVPHGLEKIVSKAMANDVGQRYQTADEMLNDMEKLRAVLLRGEQNLVPENVIPIGNMGEMSRENYSRRKKRAGVVGTMSGIFLVLLLAGFLSVFLWNYWLRGIFSAPTRVDIPNFVGSYYTNIVNSKNFTSMFNFEVKYEINPDVDKDIIIAQSPEAGKSYMLTDKGINVQLKISTGVLLENIPNVIHSHYREATTELEKLGFNVEKEYESSSTVETDYIIDISPSPGEKVPAGATVYITISLGHETENVFMPDLRNVLRSEAEQLLADMQLSLVSVNGVYNDEVLEGRIISQNIEPGTEIPSGSKIYLQYSLGPAPSPTPEADQNGGENG